MMVVWAIMVAMAPPAGYTLVFSDEFERDGKPDPAKWTYEKGFVRNQELQWYTSSNANVKGGRLVIEARREQVENPNFEEGHKDWRRGRELAEYTSACVKTLGKHSWTYGRFEIRAKITARKGLWPAIWTVGDKGPWPSGGEIDLMEYYQDTILANTAWGVGGGTWNTVRKPYPHFLAKDPKWDESFHVWRMDWDKDFIRIYLDDELLNETDLTKTVNHDGRNPFHEPHHLLLNLAIGSTGGDPNGTEFPNRFEVDYVRVYQRQGK